MTAVVKLHNVNPYDFDEYMLLDAYIKRQREQGRLMGDDLVKQHARERASNGLEEHYICLRIGKYIYVHQKKFGRYILTGQIDDT